MACGVLAGLAVISGRATEPVAAADYTRYHTYDQLTAALRDLAKAHGTMAKLVEVAKTHGGRTVWALEIANPAGAPLAERPALLIAANFEGDQLIGSELALFTADALLTGYAGNPAIKQRLDEHVFYILPRVNPDGAEMMFGVVKGARKTNSAKFDNDNDGRLDEDGPEDLNNDGVISMMRHRDGIGPYMRHPDDPRLMRRADPQKGEAGGYTVYWEGIDNDGDGFYNEDPVGGIDLNRNFQHKYPYYQPDAGPHMISEPEARGVMDYVLQRRNIAAILTFGESDNLIAPPGRRGEQAPASTIDLIAFADASLTGARAAGRFRTAPQPGQFFFPGGRGEGGRGAAPAGGRGGPPPTPPATTVNVTDVEYFRTISDKYRELTGIRAAPPTRTPAGAFFEYGYYQFGVPSFSTPGWGITGASPPPGAGRPPTGAPAGRGAGPGNMLGAPAGRGAGQAPSTSSGQAPSTGSGQAPSTGSGQAPSTGSGQAPSTSSGQGDAEASGGTAAFDLRLVRWMDAETIDGFVAWQPFKHPELGDVEIGGFRPYVYSNPPAARIAELGKTHVEFVTYLSSVFPKVAIVSTTVKSLGAGLFRIKAEVENSGLLPTSSAQGVRSRSVKPTMVQLGVAPDDIVSGAPKTNFFPALAGSGRRQSYEWIVKGKPGSTITLKAVAQKGGTAAATLTLK
jgi:hypothetical protein